ncbi:GGDEF domain-containing protein [Actinoplanes sichuanensis]|uniref:GGDEF domain-containing protein n=1 Tax=Actinoplanes sichuanensis TaxID=512349 RepID=A0ABW4AG45_9ACTN|nr:GGDEF domain-containing protein [Actinoplanes sichuanensis]
MRRLDDWLWSGFLLGGVALTLGALLLPQPGAEWALTGVESCAGLAVLAGLRRYRPENPLFWKLLAAGLFFFALTHLAGPRGPGPLVDQLALGTAFLLVTAAMVVRVRSCSLPVNLRANLLDGAMVVLGVMAGAWPMVIGPVLAERWHHPTPAAVFGFYTILTLLRLAAAAVLLLAGNPRNRAHQLIVASTFLLFAADAGYAASDRPPTVWHILAWMTGHLMIGAAALHPSMARAERGGDPETLSRTRLGLFAVLTAFYPLMTGLNALPGLAGGRPPAVADGLHMFVLPMLLGVGVSVLLVLRMGMLGNLAQRRARALDAALREQEALRAELEHRATHDPLTGLGNRAALTEALTTAVGRPVGDRGWLLLLDLDGFKEVNDTLGHPVGDELLVALGDEFRRITADGLVARLGGDEFAVLVPGDAVGTADRLLRAAAVEHLLGGAVVRVSASIGVLDLDDVHSCAEALRDADVALYAAKAAGRGCHRVHAPETDRRGNRAATGVG